MKCPIRSVCLPIGCIAALLFCFEGLSAAPASPQIVPRDGVIFGPAQQTNFAASCPQTKVDLNNGGLVTSLQVQVTHGPDAYPGVDFSPKDAQSWDLSAYGYVDAAVINTGNREQSICLRIDNAGDWRTNPWNAENVRLKAGEKGTVRVIFGSSFGKPAFKLKPSEVVRVKLFTENPAGAQSFRVDSITAGGKPGDAIPVKSEDVRVVPADGRLLSEHVEIGADQIEAKSATAATVDGAKLKLDFPANTRGEVIFKPKAGKWDLREYLQLSIQLRNTGKAPVVVKARAESNASDTTDWADSHGAIPPGAAREIVIPFIAEQIWTAEGTGNKLANDAVSGIHWTVEPTPDPASLSVESIIAGRPAQDLPNWLGARPPVGGKWTKTFEDNFGDGAIDSKKWNVKTANYWDVRSHFSKENVLVGDGVAKLRFEKKRGFHNDEPSEKQTDYATGFLDTFGKFTQRYGYFESRMKLPKSPGLWPAFWLMPDRGASTEPQWKRSTTEEGGMEFDIMEYLSRWGSCRYNIAMHWDGYEKNHKSIGSDRIYAQPDKEGFITAGLLWLPGEAVYYVNGKEVARWNNTRVSNVPSYIMFTHVSGGWDNDPLDDAKLPANLVIDYTRVWQRDDLLTPPAR